MTPAQRAALEALVGREITADEAAQLDTLLDPDNRNDVSIAALLSVGRWRYADTRRMEVGFVGSYPGGPIEGDAVLGTLERHAESQAPTARIVGRALRAMRVEPGLNLGDPSLHAMLDLLAPAVLSVQQVDDIKAMARVPHPVVVREVSRALNVAEGRMHME